VHVAQTGATTEVPNLFDDPGGIGDGFGVRHGVDRRIPTNGGGRRTRCDSLSIFSAGFSEVGMEVDQTRKSNQSEGIDLFGASRRHTLSDLRDDPVSE
jgi:hypothetical protein